MVVGVPICALDPCLLLLLVLLLTPVMKIAACLMALRAHKWLLPTTDDAKVANRRCMMMAMRVE